MRLIDADALRDRLRSLADDGWNKSTATSWAEAFSECADMVDEAPTIEPQQRWITCSERLPEKEEQVLIYAWNVHYVLAKYREIRTCDGVYKMAWVTEDAYSTPREIKHEVICWMPLPEPYAERRTDG